MDKTKTFKYKNTITVLPNDSKGITLSEKEKFGRTLTVGRIQDSNVKKIPVGKSGNITNWLIKNNNNSPICIEILEKLERNK